jgi:primosomal replication protein N
VEDDNRIVLQGSLVELDALRHTPAGIAILKFRLAHESIQTEMGTERKVSCELAGVAFDVEARLLASAPLGAQMRIAGFLDRRSRNSKQVVLHATKIDFLAANAG